MSYDKYWNLHFNFDTQGYYLRQSYRSDIEYELLRAYGIMEIYYNIFDPYTKGVYLEYNNKFCAALDRLETLDAGVSPEEVCDGRQYSYYYFKNNLHCNTLNRDISGVNYTWQFVGNNVPVDLLDEYLERLHGRTLWDDMLLAGMVQDTNSPSTHYTFKHLTYPTDSFNFEECAHGIGFNGKQSGTSTYKGDVILYSDEKVHKGMTIHDECKKLSFPDDSDNKHWACPVLFFKFV